MLRVGKGFEWINQCQKAFEALNEYLKEVQLLTRPGIAKPLFLYLGVNDKAISVILLINEGYVDQPIYYINKVLLGAKNNYPFIEKIALALVIASRKLKPYFQSHLITVID